MKARKPMTITLCGSTKFKKQFESVNIKLSLAGHCVFSVAAFSHADRIPISPDQKKDLDEVHKRKIDQSDGIYVIDVNGYIGESTRNEIDYARSLGKPIAYYSSHRQPEKLFASNFKPEDERKGVEL